MVIINTHFSSWLLKLLRNHGTKGSISYTYIYIYTRKHNRPTLMYVNVAVHQKSQMMFFIQMYLETVFLCKCKEYS